MSTYIALIRKDPKSDYGVEFPDFPGCVSAGRDLEEARRLAAEALALHVTGMLDDEEPLPEPASLETIMADPANREAVGFLVDLPTKPTQAVRINITLPSDLVNAIDRASTNRSRFLADAARAQLRRTAA